MLMIMVLIVARGVLLLFFRARRIYLVYRSPLIPTLNGKGN